MFRLPLFGIRVLDLSTGWAGPYAARLLADMGAEVIKIEAVSNWDPLRSFTGQPSGLERAWDRSPFFNHVNRNKYGCVLDAANPRGRDLFLHLVAISDVVVESFPPGNLESLGLSFQVLREINPQVIGVSMSDEGEPPVIYGYAMAGAAAAGAIALALWDRRRSGRGQHIEVDQRENLINLIGEQIVAYSMSGREPPRRGNRHSSMAPHGCYPCAGDDQWVTIACQDDAQFAALCAVLGQPALAGDPRFADGASRYRNQDALDGIIAVWTRQRSKEEAAQALQVGGVPAMPVLSVPEVFADQHLRARGFWESVSHSLAGVWEMEGPHWRMSESPGHIRLPTPAFGEHNHYVFRDLLGLSEDEIAALEEEGVTGRTPGWPAQE